MFGDHVASANKQVSTEIPDFMANAVRNEMTGLSFPGDSLSVHVQKVYRRCQGAFEMLHQRRELYPALEEQDVPTAVMNPKPSGLTQFKWQHDAAVAARSLCSQREGGFFACLVSGTGTGKTRGAPTILANAAMGDKIASRRYLRMNLALGLRVLTTQSAAEYVNDLGFSDESVSVLVGQAPLEFGSKVPSKIGNDDNNLKAETAKVVPETPDEAVGSGSIITIPDWLNVENILGNIPSEGDLTEALWLQSLSTNTDRSIPSFLERALEASGSRGAKARLLITPPVMVGTIDHLMAVAAPTSASFLFQTVRVMTSDLILDEIDQYDGEDIAAIGRLVYQTGAAGRRVIIMSATLTPHVADSLYTAYQAGWADYAATQQISSHVNLLCTGDIPGSCFTNGDDSSFLDIFDDCRGYTAEGLRHIAPLRRGRILPPVDSWEDLMKQVDDGISEMHDLNHVEIEGFKVSVGLIKFTRISHTGAAAAQLVAGPSGNRLRLKICLHSNFPRLHREWIELQLKRALTRKGNEPHAGLRAFCDGYGVFERANEMGCRQIEIVVVASPVIETGNDLDFDYAILDPISMRSIIQSAGRVCRHRPSTGTHTNVLIFGRSPIAMQGGKMAMPGVETRPHPDTLETAYIFHDFDRRLISALAGDEDFAVIDASPILSDFKTIPLREAEASVCRQMISIDGGLRQLKPLGRYISSLTVRLNSMMTLTRKFRRSSTDEVEFIQKVVDNDLIWYVDLDPRNRLAAPVPAETHGLSVHTMPNAGHWVFRNLSASAISDFFSDTVIPDEDLEAVLRVKIQRYDEALQVDMTYTEFTGFTRRGFSDLLSPFGLFSRAG
jgi:CRISPR-associated endonuclease/helicase Cas3